jgi:hypothetical protein
MLIVDSQNNVNNLIYCQTSLSVSSRGCMQGIYGTIDERIA